MQGPSNGFVVVGEFRELLKFSDSDFPIFFWVQSAGRSNHLSKLGH